MDVEVGGFAVDSSEPSRGNEMRRKLTNPYQMISTSHNITVVLGLTETKLSIKLFSNFQKVPLIETFLL